MVEVVIAAAICRNNPALSYSISSNVKTWKENQYEEWSLIYTPHLIDHRSLEDVNKLLMFQEKIAFLRLSGELNDRRSVLSAPNTLLRRTAF